MEQLKLKKRSSSTNRIIIAMVLNMILAPMMVELSHIGGVAGLLCLIIGIAMAVAAVRSWTEIAEQEIVGVESGESSDLVEVEWKKVV